MTTFHIRNYGQFGESLPCDIDGYCHTRKDECLKAPMDWGPDGPCPQYAAELAKEARLAIKLADRALEEWRESN